MNSGITVSKQTIFQGKVDFLRFDIHTGDLNLQKLLADNHNFFMENLQPFIDQKRKFVVRLVAYLERDLYGREMQLLHVQSGPADFNENFLEQHAKILESRLAEHAPGWEPTLLLELGFDCILPNGH